MSPENSDPQFHLDHRGPVSMKGKKEPMQVWFLSRKNTGTEVWLIRALLYLYIYFPKRDYSGEFKQKHGKCTCNEKSSCLQKGTQ